MNQSVQEFPIRYQMMFAAFAVVLGLMGGGLVLFINSHFGFSSERISLFFVFRALVGIVLAPLSIPLVIFAEFIGRVWKKREFKWRRVGVYMGFLGEYLVVTALLLTVCDLLFSSLDFLWQLPLTASSMSIGLIIMVLTVRRFRDKLDF